MSPRPEQERRPAPGHPTGGQSGWLGRFVRSAARSWGLALALLTTVAAHLAFARGGLSFVVPWNLFQLLDRRALEQHPLDSLLLLHGQPPLLNALAAAALAVSRATGASLEHLLSAFFLLVSLATVALTYRLVRGLVSRGLALVLAASLALDPGFHYHAHVMFYPHLLQLMVAGLLLCAAGYLRHKTPGWLLGAALTLALLANTRALFHPLWAAGSLGLLVALARAPRRHVAAAFALLALLVLPWPLKNLAVFGRATSSSWTGFNLARELPVRSPRLGAYLARGEVPADTRQRIARIAAGYPPAAASVIASPVKAGGHRNWNHLVLWETAPALGRRALAWRLNHPARWLARAGYFYQCWALPTHVNPYTLEPMAPLLGAAGTYDRLYRASLYADLRPLWQSLRGKKSHPGKARKVRGGGRHPFTLFGYVVMPLVLGAVVLCLWRRRRRRGPPEGTSVFALALALWVLVVPLLTDGFEANRMRHAVGPAVVTLLALVVSTVTARRGEDP